MSASERLNLLKNILSRVGNDKEAECKWGMLAAQTYIEIQIEEEDLLTQLQNGTIDINEFDFSSYYPGLDMANEFAHYYGNPPKIARELYGDDISSYPRDTQIQILKMQIADHNLYITQYNIILLNPKITPERKADAEANLKLYMELLNEAQKNLDDLLQATPEQSMQSAPN